MTSTKAQLDEIIRKYHVTLASGDRIHAVLPRSMGNAEAQRVIGSRKQALVDRIREVEDERVAGDARVAAIPRLAELREYRKAMRSWHAARDRAWETGEPRWPSEPERPEGDTSEAEAYLELERMASASNDRKSAAGRHGIEAVRSGEKAPREALEAAEAEWSAAALESAWV